MFSSDGIAFHHILRGRKREGERERENPFSDNVKEGRKNVFLFAEGVKRCSTVSLSISGNWWVAVHTYMSHDSIVQSHDFHVVIT